jgi:hypothetical protein
MLVHMLLQQPRQALIMRLQLSPMATQTSITGARRRQASSILLLRQPLVMRTLDVVPYCHSSSIPYCCRPSIQQPPSEGRSRLMRDGSGRRLPAKEERGSHRAPTSGACLHDPASSVLWRQRPPPRPCLHDQVHNDDHGTAMKFLHLIFFYVDGLSPFVFYLTSWRQNNRAAAAATIVLHHVLAVDASSRRTPVLGPCRQEAAIGTSVNCFSAVSQRLSAGDQINRSFSNQLRTTGHIYIG